MGSQSVGLAAAFIAGLISFFSPCVLPLVPVYLGYLSGQVTTSQAGNRFRTVSHALFFVLGFGLVFVLLGAAAGLLGAALDPIIPYVIKVGGLILIVFGLHLLGLISIPLLNVEKRLDLRSGRKNYWASFLVGIVFAAGWTPCIGPVLTAILILAADSQTAATGAVLLTAYALGLGAPFVVVASLMEAVGPVLRRSGRIMRAASMVGGVLLVIMGFLLITGLFQTFVFWLNAQSAGGW
jgi:cytochrome c-type biogenesis protein